jgi:WD40 repeat protein/serine/threonine protein kinase
LLSHVEECVVCQQLLESLTSGAAGGDAAANDARPAARFDLQPANWLSRQIGQYTLINEVGEGGMGVVYRAEQAKLKRSVAVKIIRHGVNSTAGEVDRFCAEAEAVARLQHPNIVQIFEVGSQEGVYFLALEYVSGGNLDQHLAGTPQEPQAAAQLTATLARAVHHAHQRGILHRDLKPANVLLQVVQNHDRQSGDASRVDLQRAVPKIADFGLAKQCGVDADGRTESGMLLGTPSYMAPEQFSGMPGQLTPAVDVYGLGAILYQMLTGRPPFKGASPLSTLEQVKTQEPLAPRRFQRHISIDLESICLKCLEKEPRRRYATAEALADDLERCLSGRPTVARPVRTWGRTWKWAKRRPVHAALVAAVIVVAVVGLAGILWQWRHTRWELYRANIAAAASALQLHQTPAARVMLEQAPREFRNWEWYHLESQLETYSTVLSGHTAPVIGLAFSPDGKRLVSYSEDHNLRLWDTMSGGIIAVCKGHDDNVESVAFSPDGRRFASGGSDRTVRLWDGQTGDAICRCEGHGSKVMALAFSPDGTRLVSAAPHEQACRVWNAQTGEPIAVLRAKGNETLTIARNGLTFTPDGTRIVVCGTGGAVSVVNVDSGQEGPILEQSGVCGCLAVSPDGRLIVTGSTFPDDAVRIWELDSGALLAVLDGHGNAVTSVVFSPDGAHVLSSSLDRTLRVWDVAGRRQVTVMRGHTGSITQAIFHPGGTRVISASIDGTLRLWDAAEGELVEVLRGHTEKVWGCAFSANGNLLASCSYDRTVRLWDLQRIESTGVLRGHKATVYDVAFSADGRHVVSTAWDNSTRLWDATTGSQIALFKGPGNTEPTESDSNWEHRTGYGDYMLSLAFSPDGTRLATGSRDAQVQLWDVPASKLTTTVQLPGEGADSLAFSPDGKLLAAALRKPFGPDSDGHCGTCLLDALTGETVRTLTGHTDLVLAVRFSPDGRHLVSAGLDKTFRVWNTATGECLAELTGHSDRINAVAFNPRGTLLATGSSDRTIRLWNANTFREIGTLPQTSVVYGLAFSPDGTRLVSACEDNTIRLWDPLRREEVAELHGHKSLVHAVAFSPDGTRLVTGSGDATVRIWDKLSLKQRWSLQRP